MKNIQTGQTLCTGCDRCVRGRPTEMTQTEHINSRHILEQFEMVWNNVESGVIIIDAETRKVLDVNPAAAYMYGDVKEKMIGEICYKFFGQHQCPVLDLNQIVDRTEFVFSRSDGTVMPIIKSVTKTVYKHHYAGDDIIPAYFRLRVIQICCYNNENITRTNGDIHCHH